jgi:hypothetical protein
MRVFCLFFLVISSLLFHNGYVSAASCWCHLEYCINDFVIDPAQTVIWYEYEELATADQTNGSCPTAGATAPTKVCDVSGNYGTVKKWEVTGSISYDSFGVSAKVGEDVTISVSSGCSATISSWCTCCHERVRTKYKYTYQAGTCWCLAVLCITTSNVSGTNKEYQSIHCDDQPACTISSSCSTNCPSGG